MRITIHRAKIRGGLAASIIGAIGSTALAGMSLSAGTFSEEILTVQATRGKTVAPAAGVISIPYTRVDVCVDNGVAKQRFLQVFHNHSATNQGCAFTLPLAPDTTITHFNLWDQGHRYVGAIEERVRAEDVYKQVTRDEAPAMNRDPGLVRQAGNVYEMRVFPVQPGEDKQVELFSHRRLGMHDGRLVLKLPLAQMTQPRILRHGAVQSAVTEVSVWLRDELPITEVKVTGSEFQEERLDEHERLLRLRWDDQAARDVDISYTVAVPSDGAVTSWTVNVNSEQFFLLRVLPSTRLLQPATLAGQPSRRFYMAVWKPVRPGRAALSRAEDERAVMREMALEFTACMTLMFLDGNDSFQGAYRSSTPGGAKDMLPSVVTTNSYRVADWEKALGETFSVDREPAKKSAVPAPDVVQHLTNALSDSDCRLVYLFLADLPNADIRTLARLIEQYHDREFILVTEAKRLPWQLQRQPNASHYSLHNGWSAVRHKVVAHRQLLTMPEAAFGDLFASFALPAGALTQFWEKLPNYGRQWPTLQTKGTVELRDVQVFLGNSSRSDGGWARTPSAGELGVVWLSGWYVGSGAVQFELAMPNRMVLFASSKQPLQTFRLAGQTTLQPRDAGERWVGALHARQVAEMLGAEMRLLQARPTGRRQMVNTDPAARETRLTQLRREVVRLSRTFGFISSETAFIALPPDLQRKYGITPQETSAQQSYTPCPVGIVPEPAAWQLAVIGFAVLASIAWSRRRRLWQR